MSKRTDSELLADISEAIHRIQQYISDMTYDNFLKDKRTQDAVVRNLEIIGEAAKNLSGDIIKRYPQIPWKKLSGVRDRLIHHYFGVNLDIVWAISYQELPDIFINIQKIGR